VTIIAIREKVEQTNIQMIVIAPTEIEKQIMVATRRMEVEIALIRREIRKRKIKRIRKTKKTRSIMKRENTKVVIPKWKKVAREDKREEITVQIIIKTPLIRTKAAEMTEMRLIKRLEML
jgi:hypothetical protein